MYFSGQNGQLKVSGSVGAAYYNVGSLKNWSYTTQQQTLDTTALFDTDKTIIHGVRSTTGQASLLYYEEYGSSTSNIVLLGGGLIKTGLVANDPRGSAVGTTAPAPTPVLLRLQLPGGRNPADSARTVGMWAHITSFAMTCSVGEVVSADISWEAIGPIFEWNY